MEVILYLLNPSNCLRKSANLCQKLNISFQLYHLQLFPIVKLVFPWKSLKQEFVNCFMYFMYAIFTLSIWRSLSVKSYLSYKSNKKRHKYENLIDRSSTTWMEFKLATFKLRDRNPNYCSNLGNMRTPK